MRKMNGVWVIVSLLIVLLLPSSVFAQGQPLYEGVHYRKAACPVPKEGKQCIQLINPRGVDVDAQSLARKFGLGDAFKLRAQNPKATIAVCRDPVYRSVWHMARIAFPKDRSSDVVWLECPEKDRRVVTVPGEIFEFDATRQDMSLISIYDAARNAQQCGADRNCFMKAIEPVAPGGGDQRVSASHQESQPPPPTLLPPPGNAVLKGHSGQLTPQTPQPAPSVPTNGNGAASSDHSQFAFGLMLILLATAVVTIVVLVFRLKRLSVRCAEAEKKNGTLHADLKRVTTQASQRSSQLESINGELDQINAIHGARIQGLALEHATSIQQKQDEITRLLGILREVIHTYAPHEIAQLETITSTQLIRAIESGLVIEIVDHANANYGSSIVGKLPTPRSRTEAWSLFPNAERQWHEDFLTRISEMQALLTAEPSSFKRDVTGFSALDQIRSDLKLLATAMCDELRNSPVKFASTDDLMSLLSALASYRIHLQEELEQAKASADTYRRGQLEALKRTRGYGEPAPEPDDDLGPISEPSPTLPGGLTTQVPPSSAPSSTPIGLRLVSGGTDRNGGST